MKHLASHSARGAALVEWALACPLFLTLVAFSQAWVELSIVQFKLAQAAHFLVWELSSHPLSDYGGGASEAVFERARSAALGEAAARFSAANRNVWEGFWLLEPKELSFSLEPADMGGPPAGPWKQLGFVEGREARAEARAVISAEAFGLKLFQEVPLKQQMAMRVESGALPDGADATRSGGRAGNHPGSSHPSGLYLQVRRMQQALRAQEKLWSAEELLPSFLRGRWPSAWGTFVVSHNYGPLRGPACEGIPGYPNGRAGADARGGLSNLGPWLEGNGPSCFDSAPFRDTQKYRDSLYGQMFDARGPYDSARKSPQFSKERSR